MKSFACRVALFLAVLTLLGPPAVIAADAQVISYPFPAGLPASSRFHVTVNGRPMFTHAAEVADFAMFAIRGSVQVTVGCEQTVTGAVFSIHNGDSAAVEDVRFENIRVEDARDKLVDFRVGLSIYSQDCPERYHRRNPKRKPTGAGQWVPWKKLTEDEQAVARQNRGAIRNVRLSDIQLLEKVPPRSFLVNSGGELSGVAFQNVRQADRVLDRSADLGLSVEDATGVRFAQ